MNTPATMNEGYKVHVVDDDDSFRIGLTRVLNASGLKAVGYRCAGEFLLPMRRLPQVAWFSTSRCPDPAASNSLMHSLAANPHLR